MRIFDFADGPVSGRGRRHGIDGSDSANGMRVDGGQQQHGLVDGHRRRVRQWQRHRQFQRCGKREHQPAHGDADDRWSGVDCDPGWRRVHLLDHPDRSVGDRGRRHRVDQRDSASGLRLDCDEQQHRVVDDHGWRIGQRQWQRQFQRHRQYRHESTHGLSDRGRADLHGHSGGSGLHLFDDAYRPVSCRWWGSWIDECHDAGGLRMDRRQQQHQLVDRDRRRLWQRQRRG